MRTVTLIGIILLALILTKEACAQQGGIDSEFAGAGARPLSMGGAFLGLADDSTAAEFNPAGIRILRRPEVALQATHTFEKRDECLPITSLENGYGIRGEETNQWSTPSFASYVHPGQKFSWAISQLTNIDFQHEFNDTSSINGTSKGLDSYTEATNNTFGVTFATDIKPRLHIGVTLRMNRFSYQYDEMMYDQSQYTNPYRVEKEFTDWSPSINIGLLWRAAKKWSFGTVYKSGQSVETGNVKTSLPRTFGIGTAYQPNDRIRILADVDYITWSDFDSITSDDFIRNDVMRYHLGGEYLFYLEEERAWFVRGGLMHEDSNAIYYDSDYNCYLTPGYPEEDPRNHVSLGLGMATDKYQIDLAVDQILNGSTVLILSMIKYF